nr:MAG TPA_asm: hypothetical protein [Caudoviricetes sp.]
MKFRNFLEYFFEYLILDKGGLKKSCIIFLKTKKSLCFCFKLAYFQSDFYNFILKIKF